MFEPTNEQGVIVLFAQQAQQAGIEIVEIRTQYPDAVIRFGGKTYKAEFEYQASNFIAHNHDVRDCDVIVCWENDLPGFVLPVWELGQANWFTALKLETASQAEKAAVYWKDRALKAEAELQRTEKKIEEIKQEYSIVCKDCNRAFTSKRALGGHKAHCKGSLAKPELKLLEASMNGKVNDKEVSHV